MKSQSTSRSVARSALHDFARATLRKLPLRKKGLLLRAGVRALLFPRRKMSLPVFLQVEPTTRCNLSCSHCPRVLLDVPGKDMESGRFKTLIDDNPNLLLLHLQGLGEPFLHGEFFEMVEHAARRGILVGTCTNGHVLSPAILNALASTRLAYLAISVDGTGDVLERLREGADGDLLEKNIEAIARARNRGTMLAFWVVVQERNLSELDKIIALAEKHGVGHIFFTFVHAAFATASTGGSLLWAEGEAELKELRRRLTDRCRRSGILRSFSATAPPGRLTHCRWPWVAGSISAEGNVLPCCMIYDTHVFGNVFEERLDRIWNNGQYEAFRRDLKQGVLPESCRQCQYL